MHEGVRAGSVIHSARTVGGGEDLTAIIGQPQPHAYVPAAQCRAVHTLPLRRVAAGRDARADACGV